MRWPICRSVGHQMPASDNRPRAQSSPSYRSKRRSDAFKQYPQSRGLSPIPHGRRRWFSQPGHVDLTKDPTWGSWPINHLRARGFSAESSRHWTLQPWVKVRQGVPREPAASHTAEIGGYVLEDTCRRTRSSGSSRKADAQRSRGARHAVGPPGRRSRAIDPGPRRRPSAAMRSDDSALPGGDAI